MAEGGSLTIAVLVKQVPDMNAIRIDRARATLNFDMFNAFNASPVLAQNNNFGAWQRPTVILAGRLFKVGVQFDF